MSDENLFLKMLQELFCDVSTMVLCVLFYDFQRLLQCVPADVAVSQFDCCVSLHWMSMELIYDVVVYRDFDVACTRDVSSIDFFMLYLFFKMLQ